MELRNPVARAAALAKANALVNSLQAELSTAAWFILIAGSRKSSIRSRHQFRLGVRRWRSLTARRSGSADCITRIIGDMRDRRPAPTILGGFALQAESQIKLLTEPRACSGDFYSYRYFAAGASCRDTTSQLPSAYVAGPATAQGP